MDDTQNAAVAQDETSNQVTTPEEEQANTQEAGQVLEASAEDKSDKLEAVETEEEVKEEPQKVEEEAFASKFAALSRKERAMRKREAELEARAKELEEKSSWWEQLQKKKDENVLEYLAEQGLDFQTITERVLNDGKPTDEQKEKSALELLQEKIELLESKLTEKEKQELEAEEKAAEEEFHNRINDFKKQINDTIEADAEKYELINAHGAHETVYEVIRDYYSEHEKILDIEEAAQMVESELEEQAKKIVALKKIKSFLPSDESEIKQKKAHSEDAKTLENAQSSQVPPNRGNKKLDLEESLVEAASMLKWHN